jgi:DNA-binding transcriptional ArsR family regulator
MHAKDSRAGTKNARTNMATSLAKGADLAKLQSNAVRACNLLKAMANPARLLVLCQIAEGEKSVGELERAVGLSQSGLSQHLAVLRSKNLVTTRRDAQTIYYSLASEEAAAVMGTLYEVFCRNVSKQPALRLRARAA